MTGKMLERCMNGEIAKAWSGTFGRDGLDPYRVRASCCRLSGGGAPGYCSLRPPGERDAQACVCRCPFFHSKKSNLVYLV
jgi:hypothetical protein